jgi:hypothetical protein
MKIFGANISLSVVDFLQEQLHGSMAVEQANKVLQNITGIQSFFSTAAELLEIKEKLSISTLMVEEPDRAEYGDFQTNANLAMSITSRLNEQRIYPDVVIEPTCGKGNFIIAALHSFNTIKHVIGIEIYKPYVWETKFSILNFFLSHPNNTIPTIEIIHGNVFDFDFLKLSNQLKQQHVLIIGNPPWVTNAQLGSLESKNLPKKSNFKNQNGLDAITGKGNFDIAEYIVMSLFDAFQKTDGYVALLVKNSVIKNVAFDQKSKQYAIGSIEKHCIDSKKEFGVSVEASLLFCKLNASPSYECSEYNLYTQKNTLRFGWIEDKFVSNMEDYLHTQFYDGNCPFEWRQGIKHDCSAVMELDKVNDHFVNNLHEEIFIEQDLIYGLLKSSDLKNTVIDGTRKYMIVTQNKVGQETRYIKQQFPKTYQYLSSHAASFSARKSSIYKEKPAFSIFGIGDYSFKPYKVAISGLYKTFHFTLVLPQNNKPVMLDDTCYFVGFDNLEYAIFALILLNTPEAARLLQAITFPDAKRVFTKDVLMRIDLLKLALSIQKQYIEEQLVNMNTKYSLSLDLSLWSHFIEAMTPIEDTQTDLFH